VVLNAIPHYRKGAPLRLRRVRLQAHRFACAACGSRRVDVSPDWRGHRAAAMGR